MKLTCRGAFSKRLVLGTMLASLLIWNTASLCVRAAQYEAADTVLLQSKDSGTPEVIRGTVVDYNRERIVVRAPYGRSERSYPTAGVVDVRTPHTESQLEALEQFKRAEYAEAEKSLIRALDEELRPWVRREIMALLVRCALKRGDYKTAGSRFLASIASEPRARHFHLIPLVWAHAGADQNFSSTAHTWMKRDLEAARLLGAAALLFDPVHGGEAQEVLNRLVRSQDERIRWLAQSQLWRKRTDTSEPRLKELQWWADRIDDMPAELRGGPYYVLGEALWQQREYDRSARALLWSPLVYAHDTHLAARATMRAAEALSRVGQTAEAQTLYREVTRRFGTTPFAGQAAEKLSRMLGERAAIERRDR